MRCRRRRFEIRRGPRKTPNRMTWGGGAPWHKTPQVAHALRFKFADNGEHFRKVVPIFEPKNARSQNSCLSLRLCTNLGLGSRSNGSHWFRLPGRGLSTARVHKVQGALFGTHRQRPSLCPSIGQTASSTSADVEGDPEGVSFFRRKGVSCPPWSFISNQTDQMIARFAS